ncbi:MAG: inositol monophosphatase [Balneolaceae bacterium]|nr:inositol monophosphatase [Balneolaceae bacterium]
MKFNRELEIAKRAANEAADIIQAYRTNQSFDIELKGKNDLVTDADLASEKKIIEVIKSEFPEDQFLAEESNTYTELPEGRIWIIDPIDGTTNFAHGFAPFCVSIALWVDGAAKVAVVFEVAHDELFSAVEGEGAWLNDSLISVSSTSDPSKSLIATGFPYSQFDLVDPYLALLKNLMQKTHGIRRAGASSYDLCCVAAGRVEGFYEYGLSPWDVGAGSLIIKEAGGIVTDWKGGDNWLFGKRIIAGNGALVDFLTTEIQNVFLDGHLTVKG